MSEHFNTTRSVTNDLDEEFVSDGLPVVPPTDERITEMVRGTDRSLEDEVVVSPSGEALTIEEFATYAVLAGCSPIHMPVLLAGARAMADPAANVDVAARDPGSWALQWIINGPVRGDLDVRSDTGAFGPGFQANRTIGRALGFAYETAQSEQEPDESREVTGTPFKYTLVAGENEERSPWTPFHVDQGYQAEESTITLSPRRSFIQSIPYGMDVDGVLRAMQYNTIPDMTGRETVGRPESIVHTVAPYNADELHEVGMSKEDVKEYLVENSVLPYDEIGPSLGDSNEPTAGPTPTQGQQIESSEYVQIYVVGGSGRFSAVGHAIGGPVTMQIEFPRDWESLVDEYYVERDWGGITEQYDREQK